MRKSTYIIFTQVFLLFFIWAIWAIWALHAPPLHAAPEEVKVPVTIALKHPIAGAQFEFRHTDGLEFLSFERSEAVKSAIMTPTVAKDGKIHVGFFGRDNSFVPKDGELNAGYLVFSHSGAAGQTLAMTEVKLVDVIDKDTTNSELIYQCLRNSSAAFRRRGVKAGFQGTVNSGVGDNSRRFRRRAALPCLC